MLSNNLAKPSENNSATLFRYYRISNGQLLAQPRQWKRQMPVMPACTGRQKVLTLWCRQTCVSGASRWHTSHPPPLATSASGRTPPTQMQGSEQLCTGHSHADLIDWGNRCHQACPQHRAPAGLEDDSAQRVQLPWRHDGKRMVHSSWPHGLGGDDDRSHDPFIRAHGFCRSGGLYGVYSIPKAHDSRRTVPAPCF